LSKSSLAGVFDSEDQDSAAVIPVSRDKAGIAELNKQVAESGRIDQDRPSDLREVSERVERLGDRF
jgi:hypothetical protein